MVEQLLEYLTLRKTKTRNPAMPKGQETCLREKKNLNFQIFKI